MSTTVFQEMEILQLIQIYLMLLGLNLFIARGKNFHLGSVLLFSVFLSPVLVFLVLLFWDKKDA